MSSSAKKKAKLEHNQDNFLNRREKRRIFGPRDKRFQNRNGDARPPLPDEELVKRQLQLSRERRHKREYEIILGIIANRKLNFKIKK